MLQLGARAAAGALPVGWLGLRRWLGLALGGEGHGVLALGIAGAAEELSVAAPADDHLLLAALGADDVGLLDLLLRFLLGRLEGGVEGFPETLHDIAVLALAGGDLVELPFEFAGEGHGDVAVHVLDEEVVDSEAELLGNECAAFADNVGAAEHGLHDGGVGAGPPDALFLQRLDEGGLGEAGRGLGEVLLAIDGAALQGVAVGKLREGGDCVGGVAVGGGALLRGVDPESGEMAREDEALGVGAEAAPQLAALVRVDLDRDGGVAGIGELARHEALPDEGVGAELVAVQNVAQGLGGAGGGGGADGLVGLLGAARAGAVDTLLLRHVVVAPAAGGVTAGIAAGNGRDAEGVGAHVGDEADRSLAGDGDALVELLGEGHRALGAEPEAVVGGLLIAAGGEGRRGAALALSLLDRLHGEVGAAQGGEEGVGGGLVREVAFFIEPADTGEARELRAELLASAGEAGVDAPVLARGERLDLALALHDQPEGDALDAAGAGAASDLALHEPAEGVADQAIEDAASLLGLDQVTVEHAGVLEGGFDGGLRDLVEDDALSLLGRGCPQPRGCARRWPRPHGRGRSRGRRARRWRRHP